MSKSKFDGKPYKVVKWGSVHAWAYNDGKDHKTLHFYVEDTTKPGVISFRVRKTTLERLAKLG